MHHPGGYDSRMQRLPSFDTGTQAIPVSYQTAVRIWSAAGAKRDRVIPYSPAAQADTSPH